MAAQAFFVFVLGHVVLMLRLILLVLSRVKLVLSRFVSFLFRVASCCNRIISSCTALSLIMDKQLVVIVILSRSSNSGGSCSSSCNSRNSSSSSSFIVFIFEALHYKPGPSGYVLLALCPKPTSSALRLQSTIFLVLRELFSGSAVAPTRL